MGVALNELRGVKLVIESIMGRHACAIFIRL